MLTFFLGFLLGAYIMGFTGCGIFFLCGAILSGDNSALPKVIVYTILWPIMVPLIVFGVIKA
jgi:hypothetical protein